MKSSGKRMSMVALSLVCHLCFSFSPVLLDCLPDFHICMYA